MRLIDADVLVETLQNEPKYSIELPANIGDAIKKLLNVHQKMVIDVIKKQPTAYDPEAVVAELEEYKYSHLVEHDSERYEHCKEEEINCDGRDCFLCVWDKAIEIVRNGGV